MVYRTSDLTVEVVKRLGWWARLRGWWRVRRRANAVARFGVAISESATNSQLTYRFAVKGPDLDIAFEVYQSRIEDFLKECRGSTDTGMRVYCVFRNVAYSLPGPGCEALVTAFENRKTRLDDLKALADKWKKL